MAYGKVREKCEGYPVFFHSKTLSFRSIYNTQEIQRWYTSFVTARNAKGRGKASISPFCLSCQSFLPHQIHDPGFHEITTGLAGCPVSEHTDILRTGIYLSF